MNLKLNVGLFCSGALAAVCLAIASNARSGRAFGGGSNAHELLSVSSFYVPSTGQDDGNTDIKLLRNLAEYRKWTLVNPTPVLMDPIAAQACAAVVGRNMSPHANRYISVYVNPDGRDAMLTQQNPKFPVGSIIVKEKLKDKSSQTPELLTVMFKREAGYDSASGDWEYLLLDGSAASIIERGKLKSCNSCHVAYQHSDYVTRTYLPDPVRKNLK